MSDIPEKFLSAYNAKETEERIYKRWEESGFFNPDVCIEKGIVDQNAEPFSIVLPPPNETGILHIGHASMISIEDAMVRFNRMRGKRTVWIPGTDHAAIATNAKVEKMLNKKGIKRHDIGREAFLEEVEKFTADSRGTILDQVRSLGASLDWSRLAYTQDEERSVAVNEAFKRLYDLGLIYRGSRIINWDVKAQTTISDDEIVYEETKGALYYFKYSKDFPITIATTRPETKVGDTAVAVHPGDPRYKKYIGETYTCEFAGIPLEITVVGDEEVDPEYGTGAVGVTPAHSYTDWEIAKRHDLPLKQVINEYGKMENVSADLEGKKTKDAREVIVTWLKEEDLLEKEEEITQNISTSERTGSIIEPLPKLQWWIDVNKTFTLERSNLTDIESGQKVTLKELMRKVIETDDVEILPERFERVYLNWIDNLHDWNISRQIWFGHRVPVWYRSTDDHGKEDGTPSDSRGVEMHVGSKPPENTGWEQDPDTLDTWFSSGLWTFSTLGWPGETDDLQTYHPTNVLETGYDIIFFWVARMILMTTALLGEVPFRVSYLHGLVRDEHGRKISKSLGNNIDPVDIIETSGADALRMALLVGVGPGNDNNLSRGKIKAYKHFANKIWNASRFVLENLPADFTPGEEPEKIQKKDEENLKKLKEVVNEVTDDMENYRFYLASEKLYHYFWHEFADVIIEESKERLESNDDNERTAAAYTLWKILETSLRLLHPFMPFVTEEIWTHMPKDDDKLLMVSAWPKIDN